MIIWEEQWGRQISTTSAEVLYYGHGEDSVVAGGGNDSVLGSCGEVGLAYSSLKEESAGSFCSLPRTNIDIKEIEGDANAFYGIVSYGATDFSLDQPVTPEEEPAELEFDIGAATQHITQSRKMISVDVPTGGVAPVVSRGIIGFTRDAVEGTDILVPQTTFAYSRVFSADAIDATYIALLRTMVGTVNDDAFGGAAAGEVLLIGVQGRRRSDLNWSLTFRFALSSNRENFIVNPADPGDDQIEVASKLGWEYLWIRYEDHDDDTAKKVVKRAIEARVEKVYELTDFSDLNLGV